MKKAIAVFISVIFILTVFVTGAVSAYADTSKPLFSEYNNDISNLSYVTEVKSQGEYGNCWAFATVACCEAEAIKNHGASTSIDLSELHLAYFAYNGERSTGDKVISYQSFYNNGGYPELSAFTLSSWIGLVDESTAKYSDFIANPSIKLDKSLMYDGVEYYVSNVHTYDISSDIDKVKQAILAYGAVQTAYYSNDYYLNTHTYAHYCPSAYTSDHAVTIVGWDDNYSSDHFKSSARPQSNGAWLVKNSWGSDWGLSGYFWLSYEDKSITTATAFDVTPASEYAFDNNYQHDGGISLTYSEYSTAAIANIFTAKGSEELLAVGVTTYNIPNADYTLKIYRNPQSLTPSQFNKGTPVHEQSGKISEIGFSTIPLTSPVALSENDVFVVLIETNAHIALDMDQNIDNGSTVIVTSDASVLSNQTYVSVNGGSFYDPTSTSQPFNARIKAFTKNLTLGTAELKSLPTASSIEYGKTLITSTLSGGEVIDSLSKKRIDGTWYFTNSTQIVANGDTVKVIFIPLDSGYDSIEAEITANVTESKPIIYLYTDKESYRGGDTVYVSSAVKNVHASTLNDLPAVKYYYQINDGEKIYFTSSFTLPEKISGMKITIAAVTDYVENKYVVATSTISFSTDATENENPGAPDDSNSQTPSTPTNPEGNQGSTSDTQNGSQSGIQGDIFDNENDGSNDSIKETTPSDETEEKATETSKFLSDVENDLGDITDFGFSGCFSSASISAVLTVSAILGFALIRKKKDDE